jgi:hypothetical protein
MALNFPIDTSQPYIDPASGLKYLYNGEVGGWETAIQPPVVVSSSQPIIDIAGFLWWDSVSGRMFVLYDDGNSKQWVDTTPSATAIGTSSGPIYPFTAKEGDFWYNTTNKRLHIYTEGQWYDLIQDVLDFYKISEPEKRDVDFSHYAPRNPKRGDIWFDRASNKAHIYSDVEGFIGWKSLQRETAVTQNITNTQAVEVPKATNNTEGVLRFATQAEVNSGTGTKTAISPGTLKTAIKNYVSTLEVATPEEVSLGVVDNKAVTPATLTGVLGSVPVGTIITHVNGDDLPGYLLCDGRNVSRTIYNKLFEVTGSNFGNGDGQTTFTIPSVNPNPFFTFIKF